MQNLFQEVEEQKAGALPGAVMSVLVPYPVDKVYDYIVPEGLDVQVGDYVTVPLGQREVPAVVWGEAAGDVKSEKLKAVVLKHSMKPMPPVMREFIDWVARYTMSPKGFVLKMALSAPGGLDAPKPAKGYAITSSLRAERSNPEDVDCRVGSGDPPRNDVVRNIKLTEKQSKVMTLLDDGSTRIAADIARAAGVSAGVVKGLVGKGLVREVDIFNPAPCRRLEPLCARTELSEDQQEVADILKAHISSPSLEGGGRAEAVLEEVEKTEKPTTIQHPHPNLPPQEGRNSFGFKAFLLDGVTGAGKTEVYFEAVAEALEKGRQVLILLPEIALSNAFLDRFEARFGCAPALWHSHLSAGQRKTTWRGVAEGHSKVVVGARSALFLPYQNLGLIIVDEEHDPAYKQEDGVIYHARDMAVVRAKLGGFPIVLVSATPSLETVHNAWTGRYAHLHLPDRFGGARMPEIDLVDMRRKEERPDVQHFISTSLKEAMVQTLERGEQVLLFLNRRGYAPLTLCRSCGHRMECPRCTAWLVEHKKSGALQCHHCGYSQRAPKHCPECSEEDSFVACGPGVERIYEEAKVLFPEARILLLASDTAESNEALRAMLEDIRARKVDIIIGTQIIAKGHHFPSLTLVGVVDADLGLQGGELRAAERCYQLLHQVAGRAGREDKPGRVLLQTFMPEHRIMKALAEGLRDPFLEAEAHEREAAHMPPYSRLVGIIVSGRDERLAFEVAKELGRTAPQGGGLVTLGPAPAPFARLRGKYRYRLLVQADKAIDIQKTIAHWIGAVKVPSTVRVYVDIDPQSFL